MKGFKTIIVYTTLIIALIVLFVLTNTMNRNINIEKQNVKEVIATVLNVDNSHIVNGGIANIGSQELIIRIESGKFKNIEVSATNLLLGKLDMDNYFVKGDKITAIILLSEDDEKIISAKATDLYRQNTLLVMTILFFICLLVYAKTIGLKALFSFVASLFILWNFLVKWLLEGKNPILVSCFVLMMLTAIIIFSIAGLSKKGVSAFIGTICGLLVTIILTVFFGDKLGLWGMTQAYSETLLFSGNMNLNMKDIFYAAIIIGASGAAMDIAMDVSASMEEIKIKKPDITRKELLKSGFNVGRAVIGTMTTTLLLAYSGGYLTLLMLFMTKDSSFMRILNLKIVSAEIMRTLIGSIGLVLVAPITAFIASYIYTEKPADKMVQIVDKVNNN